MKAHQQRRVFRGRGGPTDRRLPKQNARRRKGPATSISDSDGPTSAGGASSSTQQETQNTRTADTESVSISRQDADEEGQDEEAVSTEVDKLHLESDDRREDKTEDWQREIHHLLQRIRNNHHDMRSESIVLPSNYQRHALDATVNTVGEWKAILKHHGADTIDPETAQASGLAVFELVQHAVSCGPLAGGKPAYMKRCGPNVARQVLDFLNRICSCLEQCSCCQDMYWSEKQELSLRKWKDNARKAIEKGQPASKSAVNRRQVAETKLRQKS